MIAACCVISGAPSYAEYIRATNEEEIILISTEAEIKMGKSMAKGVEKRFGLDEDIFLQKRISDIGQRVAAVSDRRDILYHFRVLGGEDLDPDQRINAFALPGGYIYIFRDMVELLETDSQIASILSHEVGHIAAKHSIKRIQGSLGATIFQIFASRMAQDNKDIGSANYALGQLMMSYSREDEDLADRLSVRYLERSGYDPEAILITIDKLWDRYRKMPIRDYSAFRTHPSYSERRSSIKQEIYGRIEFVDFINAPVVIGKR